MKASIAIFTCFAAAIAAGYLGLRAGVHVGRNQAVHEATNAHRAVGLVIADMVDSANRGQHEILRNQIISLYDHWYDIEFVPHENTPPERLAENVAVSIMRSEKQK